MVSEKNGAMLSPKRTWLNLLLVFVLFALLALSAGAAAGQGTALNSLGCWGHFTGGGDQRATATNRIRDEVTWVGGSMATSNQQLIANPYTILSAWRAPVLPAPPPIVTIGSQYLPIVQRGWNFSLNRMCS